MHVRFVKWLGSIPVLVFNQWFIVLLTAVLFVDIVNGMATAAFVCLLWIGVVAGLSAAIAHAQARTSRMIREVMEEQGACLEHYRRVASDACRELVTAREFIAARHATLNATLPGDVGEVIDQAHVLALDWREKAQRAVDDDYEKGVILNPDDLSELIAYIEIAAELAAPEEPHTEVTTDAAGQVVAVSTPSSKDRTDWIKDRYMGRRSSWRPIDPE